MNKRLEEFFDKEKILVRGEVSADNLQIINERLMPEGIKSAIIWLIPYYTGRHENRNVSLYAISKDYHLYAKQLFPRLYAYAKECFPNEEFYGFCDSSPINEVSAAITAGLGVLGENRLLINPTYGSFVFIGSLLTTLEVDNATTHPFKRCISCGKCRSHCDFLGGRASTCTSELNQRKQLTDDELDFVRSKKIRWGCDECQEICPMNSNVLKTPIDFFYEDMIETVDPVELENMPKEEFQKRAYSWRGKKTIIRNLQ